MDVPPEISAPLKFSGKILGWIAKLYPELWVLWGSPQAESAKREIKLIQSWSVYLCFPIKVCV